MAVDDRASAGIAGRYATALFDLAEEEGALETVEASVGTTKAALAESEDLRSVIRSPLIGRAEQGAAMAAVADKLGLDASTKNLILLMASKRRLFALPETLDDFTARLARMRGVVPAEIVSAAPLNEKQRESLEEVIKQAVGANVALDVTVDEALIGGLVVKVGSRMIDTSIRSRLAALQSAMKEAG